MKTLKLSIPVFLSLVLLIFMNSCNKEPQSQKNTSEVIDDKTAVFEEKILAKIDLGKDGYVEFLEVEPGEILISTLVRNTVKLPEEDLDPVAYYKFIKQEPAPIALVNVQKEIERSRAKVNDLNDNTSVTQKAPFNGTANRMSESEFISQHCADWKCWDVLYCWTNVTGTGWAKKYVALLYSDANCIRGSIRHRIEVGNDVKEHTVPAGWISSWRSSSIIRRNRKAMVHYADGDLYHMSIIMKNSGITFC